MSLLGLHYYREQTVNVQGGRMLELNRVTHVKHTQLNEQ